MIDRRNKSRSVFAFIFARGGSKGLPKKNIRLLLGKPLIGYAIECAFSCKYVDRVIVSTDSEEIAEVARQYGAEVPFIRPPELASDNSPEWLSWRHALKHIKDTDGHLPDIFLSVPVTAPLRLPEDLNACIEKLCDEVFDIVITATESDRNPYFNMIKINEIGCASIALNPDSNITRRQDAPILYDVTTVAYVANPKFINTYEGIFEGNVGAVVVPRERSIDIDTELDFTFAELLMANRIGV